MLPPGGLAATALVNIAFGLSSSYWMLLALWGLNGLLQVPPPACYCDCLSLPFLAIPPSSCAPLLGYCPISFPTRPQAGVPFPDVGYTAPRLLSGS